MGGLRDSAVEDSAVQVSPRVQEERCSRELSIYFINCVDEGQLAFLERSVTLKIDRKRA